MGTDWTELPFDLIISIAKRLFSFEDFIGFRAVCSRWRSAAREVQFDSSQPQLPWLTLVNQINGPDNSETTIYSLVNRRVLLLLSMPPEAYKSSSDILSSLGWILTTDRRNFSRHFLFHPINGTVIQLPDFNFLVRKFVLTASPSRDPNFSVIIVVAVGGNIQLERSNVWVWRPGKIKWSRISLAPIRDNTGWLTWPQLLVNELTYFNRRIFALHNENGQLSEFPFDNESDDDDDDQDVVSVMLSSSLRIPEELFSREEKCYLVESGGDNRSEVLIVSIKWRGGGYRDMETLGFEVYSAEGLERVSSLGDKALFVGDSSSSVSVKASDFVGFCEPDCIYFAFNDGVFGTQVVAGVFRLKEKKIDAWLRGQFPKPIWVQPSF